MYYLLLIFLALSINSAAHAMEREVSEDKKELNNEELSNRAKTTQASLLRQAIIRKDKEKIRELASSADVINMLDEKEHTPFIKALDLQDKEITHFLLSRGAWVCPIEAGEDSNSFLIAAIKGDLEGIKKALSAGLNVNVSGYAGLTALMYASALGHEEVVRFLIGTGCSINARGIHGCRALDYACYNKHKVIIKILLEAETDPHQKVTDARATLNLMIRHGFEDIIDMLLREGIEINYGWGFTPLFLAVHTNKPNIVKQLLTYGAIVDQECEVGINGKKVKRTPLMHAIRNGLKAIGEILLKAGANVNQKDAQGYTLLMRAAVNGYIEIVKMLLDHKADVNLINDVESTALSIALFYEQGEVARCLLKAGADVNYSNSKKGISLLTNSAGFGSGAMVNLLLEHGAKFEEKALIAAAEHGHIAVVSKLLKFLDELKPNFLSQILKIALKNGSLALVNRVFTKEPSLCADNFPLLFLGGGEVDLRLARLFCDDKKAVAELEGQTKTRIELELFFTFSSTEEIQEYLGRKVEGEPNADIIVKNHLESREYVRTDKYKQTVLMWAAMFGHTEQVKKILTTLIPLDQEALPIFDKDAQENNPKLDRALRYINAQDAVGRTALMYAVLYGYDEIAKLLIPYCGPTINLKDTKKNTALAYAAQRGNIKLVIALLKAGAQVTAEAIKEATEENHQHLAVCLYAWREGKNIFAILGEQKQK